MCLPAGAAALPLAEALLAQASAEDLTDSAKAILLRLLRALELRYAPELDAAVNVVLSSEAAAEGATGGALGTAERERLFALLEAAFGGTARSPVLEAGTTLALAVDAPSAAVREMVSMRGWDGASLLQNARPVLPAAELLGCGGNVTRAQPEYNAACRMWPALGSGHKRHMLLAREEVRGAVHTS
jgi:hypothetical protein